MSTIKETMTAIFRLFQANGVQGPSEWVEVESERHARELAVAWSEGEIGHPWDHCTVEIPEIDYTADIFE